MSIWQVDRQKVLSHGREAAGKLLIDLQVRKSTADGAGARAFYTELTTPLPGWEGEIRDIVLKKKLVSDRYRPSASNSPVLSALMMMLCDSASEAFRPAEHLFQGRRGRTS